MNANSLIALLLLLCLLASAMMWLVGLSRLRSGKPLLPYQPRRPAPWGLVDLAIVMALMIAIQYVVAMVLVWKEGVAPGGHLAEMTLQQQISAIVGNMVASLAVVALSLTIVMLRTRARWSDLGVELQHLTLDIRIGGRAFLMLAPPVYLIQWGLSQWRQIEHPFIETLKDNPDGRLFALIGVSAVLVAPLAEEYLFRLLLQGWLEKAATLSDDVAAMLFGRSAESVNPAKESPQELIEPLHQKAHDLANDENPYSSPPSAAFEKTDEAETAIKASNAPFWPVLVSAAMFAGMHLGHGTDPIPLFVLAIGLGYLYRQTHRILPCILVHAMLNACSTAILWLSIAFHLA